MEQETSFYEENGNKLGWSLSYKLFYMNAGNHCRLFLSMETLLNYLWNSDAILFFFKRYMNVLCFEAQKQISFAVALHII